MRTFGIGFLTAPALALGLAFLGTSVRVAFAQDEDVLEVLCIYPGAPMSLRGEINFRLPEKMSRKDLQTFIRSPEAEANRFAKLIEQVDGEQGGEEGVFAAVQIFYLAFHVGDEKAMEVAVYAEGKALDSYFTVKWIDEIEPPFRYWISDLRSGVSSYHQIAVRSLKLWEITGNEEHIWEADTQLRYADRLLEKLHEALAGDYRDSSLVRLRMWQRFLELTVEAADFHDELPRDEELRELKLKLRGVAAQSLGKSMEYETVDLDECHDHGLYDPDFHQAISAYIWEAGISRLMAISSAENGEPEHSSTIDSSLSEAMELLDKAISLAETDYRYRPLLGQAYMEKAKLARTSGEIFREIGVSPVIEQDQYRKSVDYLLLAQQIWPPDLAPRQWQRIYTRIRETFRLYEEVGGQLSAEDQQVLTDLAKTEVLLRNPEHLLAVVSER